MAKRSIKRSAASSHAKGLPISRRGMILIILAMVAGLAVAAWLFSRHWAPSRSRYPIQGVSIVGAQGPIAWEALAAQQADFAYIGAVEGTTRDPLFSTNWKEARAAGMRYGAVHRYSLCDKGADQATAFLATVPRDTAALPPAIRLEFTEGCSVRPARERLLEALTAFLKSVESHAGKPALIRVSHDFETRYRIGNGINRTLWLEGDFLPPDYAGRPWVMWTANSRRQMEGVDSPVEWDVVRDAGE